MMLDIVFVLMILGAGLAGVWACLSLFNLYIPKNKLMKKLKQQRRERQPDIFRDAGLGFTMGQFNAVRYTLYALVFAYVSYLYWSTRQLPVIPLAMFIVMLAALNPRMKKISVVPALLRYAGEARAKKLNEEVLRAFIHLKNLALLDAHMNGYEIMRKLLRHTKALKPYLSDLMKDWHRPDHRDVTLERFNAAVGTTDASNFAKVLAKIDNTVPVELIAELSLYEQQIMETRQTARERHNGMLGDLFFSLVTLLLMTVLVNFIFVVVFSNINLKF